MSQNFQSGDFLVFQLEAGFALLRLLDIDESGDDRVWHVAAYSEMFPDVESAENLSSDPTRLTISNPHVALTQRAFESTQVARLCNVPLSSQELVPLQEWRTDSSRSISDRSIRLMLGLR